MILDPKMQVQILQESIKQKLAKGVKEILMRKQSGLLKPEPTEAEKKQAEIKKKQAAREKRKKKSEWP